MRILHIADWFSRLPKVMRESRHSNHNSNSNQVKYGWITPQMLLTVLRLLTLGVMVEGAKAKNKMLAVRFMKHLTGLEPSAEFGRLDCYRECFGLQSRNGPECDSRSA